MLLLHLSNHKNLINNNITDFYLMLSLHPERAPLILTGPRMHLTEVQPMKPSCKDVTQ